MSSNSLKIIILGYIVRGPIGGRVWADLHYFLGLSKLGHDVYFVEDSGDYQYCCYDFSKNSVTSDPSYGVKIASNIFRHFEYNDRWSYYNALSKTWFGISDGKIKKIIKEADLLIAFGRLHQLRPWFERVPIRILIDKDPVFIQLNNIKQKSARVETEKYNRYFSLAENINHLDCFMPDDGIAWRPTRHPLFLDSWPKMPIENRGSFTTLMQWDSYNVEEYNGIYYGMKAESFKKIIDLPGKLNSTFELVVGGTNLAKELLEEKGWIIKEKLTESGDIWKYQNYIQNSKAEFTIAKHGYVISNSGWFSERSASYLASGRPVITQQTGFSKWLPTGEGVLAFKNMKQAIAAVEEVNNRYEFHCKKAREIAEEYFDYRKILPKLINNAMGSISVE
ncbi:MAG: glycosyltransferase [Candidatus Omnitrophica bacterium]|nr:glycosyltransferase [Candidatus Omnitrophota bacterium]